MESVTPEQDRPDFVARTPLDLIAMVPVVLGFHPAESVVLLTFGAEHGSFHARVDLPDDDPGRAEVVDALCSAVQRNRAPMAAIVVLSDRRPGGAPLAVCEALEPVLEAGGTQVLDCLQADGSEWWSLHEAAVRAQPVRHAYDLSCHPLTAQRVFAGQSVFSSRDALVESLAPDPVAIAQVEARLTAGGGRQHGDAGWLVETVGALLGGLRDGTHDGLEPSVEDAARLLVLLQRPEMAVPACVGLERGTAPDHVRIWRALLRRAPTALVPGVAGVLALAAWLAGEGALAWCAVERCLEVDPAHELAGYVAAALQQAVPPSSWRGVDLAS